MENKITTPLSEIKKYIKNDRISLILEIAGSVLAIAVIAGATILIA